MIQTLDIGKAIYSLLVSDTTVGSLVGENIFPLVAPEGTEFPYVVYSCVSMTTARDKDRLFYQQDVSEAVIVCTEDYTSGIEIATAIAQALQFEEKQVILGSGMTIDIMESGFSGKTEDYVQNTYVQGLMFNLKLR